MIKRIGTIREFVGAKEDLAAGVIYRRRPWSIEFLCPCGCCDRLWFPTYNAPEIGIAGVRFFEGPNATPSIEEWIRFWRSCDTHADAFRIVKGLVELR